MSFGWPIVRLGDVLRRRKDDVLVQPLESYKRLTIRMNGQGIVPRDVVLGNQIGTKRQFITSSGQLVLSKIDARNGAFGILPRDCDRAIITGNFWAFDADENRLDVRYLNYLTKTPLFVDFCVRASEGTTNRRYLQESKFLVQEIQLPPIEEQHRIVSRIDELAARVQLATNLRHQANSEAESLKLSGVNQLFLSLSGRNLTRIDETCEVRGGIQKSSARSPGANPRRYITVAHVQRNFVDVGDPRFFEVSDEELQRWRLRSGDVLVIEGNGSSEQIGRAALFRGEIEDCVHQNHVIRVRPNPERLMPEYLNEYFNSLMGREQMLERSRTTSGLYNLSVGRIKEIEMPLPSLEEQRKIVASAHQIQGRAEALRKLQSEATAELDALMPSVLARAFRGEL